MQWMILPFRRYFDFQGRSRRLEFWAFFLLNMGVFIALFALLFTVSGDSARMAVDADRPLASASALFSGIGILMLVWWLAALIPGIAVTVRRLHDRDMSGWWYLGLMILSMVPVIGFFASIALFVLMLLPGTDGPNRFGPSPKSDVTAEVFA